MTFAYILVILVKIVVVVAFLLTGAAVSVWADRRQSGLVQDRIGPTRAVVFLPHRVVQILLLVAALGAAALWVGVLQAAEPTAGATQRVILEHARGQLTVSAELAILVGWFSLLLLSAHVRGHGAANRFELAISESDPRSFFLGGVVLHLLAFPLLQLVPWTLVPSAAMAAEVLAVVFLVVAAGYAGLTIPAGKVGIRLSGLIHPVADTLKMMFKEEYRPKSADRLLHSLAPVLALFPALVTFAVIPFGSTMCFQDANANKMLDWGELLQVSESVASSGVCAPRQIAVSLQVADLNVGLLYIFAIAGTGIIGAAVAGWASDNKFALLGGLRATSQMISYEVTLGLTVVGMLMVTSTVHMQTIVDWQGAHAWGIFVQPIGFLLFLVASVAETKRVPFDQPEGESEIVSGYFLEYSSTKFGMFYIGEYVEFTFSAALLVTLFLGGYHLPFLQPDGFHFAFGDHELGLLRLSHGMVTLLHVITFFGKVFVVGWLLVFIRWTLPRFRYDQVMALGWKKLLPLSLVNILVTGVVILAVGEGATASGALQFLGDLSQALVALGAVVAMVAFVSWLVEPSQPKMFLRSTAARFTAAAGGSKMDRMGA